MMREKRCAQATKHKWRLIGLQLGVDVEYLDMVAKEHPDGNAQCSSFLFGQWARNELQLRYIMDTLTLPLLVTSIGIKSSNVCSL